MIREAATGLLAGPPAITREGVIAGGLGTLFALLVVMTMFFLAPKRAATSRFWQSVNHIAPRNFSRRWPWWLSAGVLAFLLAQAFFQLALIR